MEYPEPSARRDRDSGPITEDTDAAPIPRTTDPQVLANVPPTPAQRRIARVLLLALLLILLGTLPFAGRKLAEVHAFVPTLAAALFVSDSVTAALLFLQF